VLCLTTEIAYRNMNLDNISTDRLYTNSYIQSFNVVLSAKQCKIQGMWEEEGLVSAILWNITQ
jgi:hypothetical protein